MKVNDGNYSDGGDIWFSSYSSEVSLKKLYQPNLLNLYLSGSVNMKADFLKLLKDSMISEFKLLQGGYLVLSIFAFS